VIPKLAQCHSVFTPDLPGAGYSECRLDLDCRLRAAARRLLAFLDALGLAETDFVASSYGGTTALMLAALAPGRIRRLVLVAPANPWSEIGRKRLALLRNPAFGRLFPRLARLARPLYSYFVGRMWGDRRQASAETLTGYAKPLTRAGVFEHAVGIVRTWRVDMEELQAALKTLCDLPVLLLWGSLDRVVDPSSARPLARCFQNARVEIVPGAGHLPYEEAPEEFCRIVEPFLAGQHSGARRDDAGSNLGAPVRGVLGSEKKIAPHEFLF
jgi:pimeloyl-ACP methyl ester carboxylesterase